MKRIPLSTIPAQSFVTILNEQNVELSLYQRYDRLFMDIALDNETIASGCVCLNLTPIIQQSTPFTGNLMFIDTMGDSAPQWGGLGGEDARFQLVFFTEEDAE